MRPGAIVAERVSRRFRVRPQKPVTLKETLVRRRRAPAAELWALRDVSFSVEPGDAVAVVGRNGSGKTTLLRLVAGILKPSSGRLAVGGSVGSLLELGAGFHPDFTGRENVYLNGALHGLERRFIREQLDEIVSFAELERFIDLPVRTYSAGMSMRLGFAVAMHVRADVLLLDEVFAVGDEAFQRKCFGKIADFKRRGGTLVFVSHEAAALERVCERALLLRAGALAFDGPVRQAVERYRALLAEEELPEERAAGLSEWGSGEVRVTGVRVEDKDGRERRQFLSGEALVVTVRIETMDAVSPPRLLLEIRERSGPLLASTAQDSAELGWSGGPGERTVRFDADHVPLADGWFAVDVALTDVTGTHVYHRVDRAAEFLVYPDEGAAGPVRVEGRWSLADPDGFRKTTRS